MPVTELMIQKTRETIFVVNLILVRDRYFLKVRPEIVVLVDILSSRK